MRNAAYRSLAIFLLSSASLSVWGMALNVSIDSTGLAGTSAFLAFDVIDGDGVIDNTVQINGFLADTTFDSSLALLTGDATGSLNTSVTLGDAGGFNELLQPIILGNTMQFQLQLSDLFESGALVPDSFSFFILDEITGLPLFPTTDLTGADALFAIDMNGQGGNLSVYAATGSSANWTVSPGRGTVPEPGTFPLLLIGFWAIARRFNVFRFGREAPCHAWIQPKTV